VVGHVAGCDVLEQLKQWKANELDLVDFKVKVIKVIRFFALDLHTIRNKTHTVRMSHV